MQLKVLAGVLAVASSPCLAQPAAITAPAPAVRASAAADAASAPGEPFVRRSVVEDDAARIEELRVRGQLQRVVVTPKGLKSYEIIVGDGSRDLSDGPSATRGATGKRVWNVLRF